MALCQAFGTLSLGHRTPQTLVARNLTSTPVFRGSPVLRSETRQCSIARSAMVIVAKQNAKARTILNEKQRMYNKARKSAIATRMKKVLNAISGLRIDLTAVSNETIVPIEKLMSEAYQEIDKAVGKGILKKNTGGRRKSRLAHAKTKLLIDSGLYTPASETA